VRIPKAAGIAVQSRPLPDGEPLPRVAVISGAVSGGGAENHFARLAEGFFKASPHRSIVSLRHTSIQEQARDGRVVSLGFRSARDYPAAIGALRALIRETRADVVYSLSRCPNVVNIAAAHSLGARPMIALGINENLEASVKWNGSPSLRFWRAAERLLYRHADLILTNSPDSASALVREFGCTAGHVCLVRNPIPLAALSSRAQELRLQGSPLAEPYLLGSGRFVEGKGFDLLLDLYAALRPRTKPLRLVMLGDGPLAPALRQRAKALGIAADVVFPGWCDDPLPWLACAEAFVTPSFHEGLPNTVLESMATRVAVVSFLSSGWIERFAAAGAVAAAPVGDLDALRAALEEVLGDESQRTAMVDAAEREVRQFEAAQVIREREHLVLEAWRKFRLR
jgi:glycosyltransferase involved in cell wall biosynthesis